MTFGRQVERALLESGVDTVYVLKFLDTLNIKADDAAGRAAIQLVWQLALRELRVHAEQTRVIPVGGSRGTWFTNGGLKVIEIDGPEDVPDSLLDQWQGKPSEELSLN